MKSKPSLLICWLRHTDYPIFRANVRKYRDFFGKIIIYWSEHFREYYFDKFMQEDLKNLGNIQFLQPIEYEYGVSDWRNIATNYMLKFTNEEWISSVEQDWIVHGEWNELLNSVKNSMNTSDMIGWMSGTSHSYMHPSFFFIKREVLEKTSKDFSAHPEIIGSDHFATITYDVKKLGGKIVSIQDLGFKIEVSPDSDAYHLGGVNQNFLEGLKDGYEFHRPDIFYVYNYWCRKANVPQDPRFTDLSLKIEERLKSKYKERLLGLDPENCKWTPFFMVY